MLVIGGLDVAHVQKAVTSDTEVDEDGLDVSLILTMRPL